jgi:hypothetical protein
MTSPLNPPLQCSMDTSPSQGWFEQGSSPKDAPVSSEADRVSAKTSMIIAQ